MYEKHPKKKDVLTLAKILLKEILRKRRISYRQAEYMTGIIKSALQSIAEGNKSPSLDTMEQIAEGLHIKITDIFDSKYK